MGLASDVAEAISDGVNALYALLVWTDAGAAAPPPVDGAGLQKLMIALEAAMRELMYGGRLEGAESLRLTEADLARVIRLEELSAGWRSGGTLPPEVAALADLCVKALCGGMSWRELAAAAGGRAPDPPAHVPSNDADASEESEEKCK